MSLAPHVLVRTWFEEVWNQGKEEAIDRLMAPEGQFHGLPTPGGQPICGTDDFKFFFRRIRTAFPDIHISIVRIFTFLEPDMVAVHCHVTGTHLGDGLGVPPTGKSIDLSGITKVRIQNGRLAEGWNSFDILTMNQQLGLVSNL